MIDMIAGWDFLDEPMWRWFIFLGALGLMTFVWHGILDFAR